MSKEKNKFHDIAHNYYVETTQTFKLIKEIFDNLFKDIDASKKVIDNTIHVQNSLREKNKNCLDACELLKEVGYEKFQELHSKNFPNVIVEKDDKELISIKINLNEEEGKLQSAFFMLSNRKLHLNCLLDMAHIYLITLFEAFNKDFFTEILNYKTEIMKSKKEIQYEEILKYASIEDLHKYMVKKKIDEISYMNLDEFAENFLFKHFNIDIKIGFSKWNDLREKYYRRNIIVHNNGKISEIYAQKMNLAPCEIGKELSTDIVYIEECFKDIHSCISFIEEKIYEKLKIE